MKRNEIRLKTGNIDIQKLKIGTLHEICEKIKTPGGRNRLYYVKKIRQLLSADNPPIGEIVQTGVIPCLIGFL